MTRTPIGAKLRRGRARVDGVIAFRGPAGLQKLHAILLTYSFYNFDLSYCQVL